MCAKRHADSDLVILLCHQVSHNTVDSDTGKRQSQGGESAEKYSLNSFLYYLTIKNAIHIDNFGHRLVGVNGPHGLAHGAGKVCRVTFV